MPHNCNAFPYNKTSLPNKCKLSYALLGQTRTIAELCETLPFHAIIDEAANVNLAEAQNCDGTLHRDWVLLRNKLIALRDALRNGDNSWTLRKLLQTNRVDGSGGDVWPAGVDAASMALEPDIVLPHNYVPDRSDPAISIEPKDDLGKLFDPYEFDMLGYIGTYTIAHFHETPKSASPHFHLLIWLSRRFGLFQPYVVPTSPVVEYGGNNNKCHRYTGGAYTCELQQASNCDIVNNQPTSFSDACPA